MPYQHRVTHQYSGTSTDSGQINFTTTTPSVLTATMSGHGFSNGSDTIPFSHIILNGTTCAWDRGYASIGDNSYTSSTCVSFIGAGVHTIQLFSSMAIDQSWRVQVIR